MVSPEAAADARLDTAHKVLHLAVSLLPPVERALFDAVLRRDLLDALDDVGNKALTQHSRALLAHSIEELVTIRSTLPVETGSA